MIVLDYEIEDAIEAYGQACVAEFCDMAEVEHPFDFDPVSPRQALHDVRKAILDYIETQTRFQ